MNYKRGFDFIRNKFYFSRSFSRSTDGWNVAVVATKSLLGQVFKPSQNHLFEQILSAFSF